MLSILMVRVIKSMVRVLTILLVTISPSPTSRLLVSVPVCTQRFVSHSLSLTVFLPSASFSLFLSLCCYVYVGFARAAFGFLLAIREMRQNLADNNNNNINNNNNNPVTDTCFGRGVGTPVLNFSSFNHFSSSLTTYLGKITARTMLPDTTIYLMLVVFPPLLGIYS